MPFGVFLYHSLDERWDRAANKRLVIAKVCGFVCGLEIIKMGEICHVHAFDMDSDKSVSKCLEFQQVKILNCH